MASALSRDELTYLLQTVQEIERWLAKQVSVIYPIREKIFISDPFGDGVEIHHPRRMRE